MYYLLTGDADFPRAPGAQSLTWQSDTTAFFSRFRIGYCPNSLFIICDARAWRESREIVGKSEAITVSSNFPHTSTQATWNCDKDENKLLTGTSQVRWSREQSGMFQTIKVPTHAGVLCGQKTPIFQVRWQYTRRSERGHNLSWLRPTLTTGISKCQSQRSYAPIIRLRQYRQNLSILQIYCTTWSAQLEGGLSVVSGFSGFTRAFGLKIKNQ